MKAYRFRIRPLSAWATPWHADTLFGSLCWAWREIAGEQSLEGLLARFLDITIHEPPPFVLSDALPGNLLPFPIGVRSYIAENEKIKPLWCRTSDFAAWAGGTLDLLPAP